MFLSQKGLVVCTGVHDNRRWALNVHAPVVCAVFLCRLLMSALHAHALAFAFSLLLLLRTTCTRHTERNATVLRLDVHTLFIFFSFSLMFRGG
jgi:hypothetical protein